MSILSSPRPSVPSESFVCELPLEHLNNLKNIYVLDESTISNNVHFSNFVESPKKNLDYLKESLQYHYEIDEKGDQILNINLSRNRRSNDKHEKKSIKLPTHRSPFEAKENILKDGFINNSTIKSNSQTVICNSSQSNESLEFILQNQIHKNNIDSNINDNKLFDDFEIPKENIINKRDNLFSFAGKVENEEDKKEINKIYNEEGNYDNHKKIIRKIYSPGYCIQTDIQEQPFTEVCSEQKVKKTDFQAVIAKFYNINYKPHFRKDSVNSMQDKENKIFNKEYSEISNFEKKNKEKINFFKENKDKSSFYRENKDKSNHFNENQGKTTFGKNKVDLKENREKIDLKCSFDSQKKKKVIIKPLNLKNQEMVDKYSSEELSPISKLPSSKILNSNEIFGEEFWRAEFFNGSL